ncbi:hypothetical protein V2J09_008359 [Rumex salicifolius]
MDRLVNQNLQGLLTNNGGYTTVQSYAGIQQQQQQHQRYYFEGRNPSMHVQGYNGNYNLGGVPLQAALPCEEEVLGNQPPPLPSLPPPPPLPCPYQEPSAVAVKDEDPQSLLQPNCYSTGGGVGVDDRWMEEVGPAPEMLPEAESLVDIGGVERTKKKAERWSKEEHRLFLIGILKYKKGDWRSISRYIVKTRSPTQVASHAQKYNKRRESKPDENDDSSSSNKRKKKRSSIHDVTVDDVVGDDTEIARLQAIVADQYRKGLSSRHPNARS